MKFGVTKNYRIVAVLQSSVSSYMYLIICFKSAAVLSIKSLKQQFHLHLTLLVFSSSSSSEDKIKERLNQIIILHPTLCTITATFCGEKSFIILLFFA